MKTKWLNPFPSPGIGARPSRHPSDPHGSCRARGGTPLPTGVRHGVAGVSKVKKMGRVRRSFRAGAHFPPAALMAHRIAFMLKAWAAQAGRAATESLDTYNMGLGCLGACREGL